MMIEENVFKFNNLRSCKPLNDFKINLLNICFQVPELPPQFRGCVHAIGTADVDKDKSNAAAQAVAAGGCPFAGADNESSVKWSSSVDNKKDGGKKNQTGIARQQTGETHGKWGVIRDKLADS